MRLADQDALLFIVSYLKGRQEPEVRAALVDAMKGAQRSRLELPDWLLDVLDPVEPSDGYGTTSSWFA